MQIEKAEQQLLGFGHCQRGADLISLIETMGLTQKEWLTMKERFNLYYLSEQDKKDIDFYFKKKEK
ncbi:MAG: hypothetical protein EOM23_00485 [Candidatus Moranbacteria bacterium]|nr:hypothetical protein [Candidatus Moranbacteria bacterium]